MKQLARSMISLFLILDSPLTPAHGGVGGREQPHFEIRLPLDLNSEQAQIRYFLTGAFGGYGSFVREECGKHAYRIATTVEGKPADALRAVVYAPGCQIVTISVPSLARSPGHADFTCKQLPSLTFTGKVLPSESLSGRQYELEINLLAHWGHRFFGIADGGVITFRLASVTPDRDGGFRLQLPNFTRDAVTRSFGSGGASLQFIARERGTGNWLGMLEPTDVRSEEVPGLPLRPDYGDEVRFEVPSVR